MSVEVHLPLDIHAPDQLSGVMVDLQTYRSQLRDAGVQSRAGGKTKTPDLPEDLASLFTTSGISPTDGAALETLHTKLAAMLKSAPVLHLTLGAPASRTLRRQLTVWFRSQIHPDSLLTFAARSDIGGGLILRAGSRVYDFSFRAKILENKNRIMELANV